ncbi:MAG: hypothetical protein OXH05_04095, partial [Acidobacteria bacterium]|nr:hypothetical protein [Acidobacteriota bacterium]
MKHVDGQKVKVARLLRISRRSDPGGAEREKIPSSAPLVHQGRVRESGARRSATWVEQLSIEG